MKTNLIEGKKYYETELALATHSDGWMRSDLAIAGAHGMIEINIDEEMDGEPVVVVRPGRAQHFEDFLADRAKFWTDYLAKQRALTDLSLGLKR